MELLKQDTLLNLLSEELSPEELATQQALLHGSSSEALEKANVVGVVTGGVVKESVGLEYGGELTIDCSNCNKPLLDLMVVRNIDVEQKWLVKCPYCGDESFTVTTLGEVRFRSADELDLEVENFDMKDGIVILTMVRR